MSAVGFLFGALAVVFSIRRGDPDYWLGIAIFLLAGLFPLACLWAALKQMKLANKLSSDIEGTIALFSVKKDLAHLEPPFEP